MRFPTPFSREHFRKASLGKVLLAAFFLTLALTAFVLSFFDTTPYLRRLQRLINLERRLHAKQRTVEDLALNILEAPVQDWLPLEGIPQDVVIYKYVQDSLVSWHGRFPVIDDRIQTYDLQLSGYTPPGAKSPLRAISSTEQYMNLGSGWYVVRSYQKGPVTLITGIWIQNDYPVRNSFIQSGVNPSLGLPSYCSIAPQSQEGFVIFGKDNGILFSVLSDVQIQKTTVQTLCRWAAIFFVLIFILFFYSASKTLVHWAVSMVLLLGLRGLTFHFNEHLRLAIDLFSPALYADTVYRSSLAALLWSALLYFFISLIFSRQNKALCTWVRRLSRPWRALGLLLGAAALGLLAWDCYSLIRSVALNSSIVLEVYKLDEINLYTFLAYFIFLLYFITLLLLARTFTLAFFPRTKPFWENRNMVVVYFALSAAFTIGCVSVFGTYKEYDRSKVWLQKMSNPRDLNFEIQLKKVESFIEADPILSVLVHRADRSEVIAARLAEVYFADFMKKYDLRLTLCSPGDMLRVDRGLISMSCYNYFHSEVLRHGVALTDASHFYYRPNDKGDASYIGIFSFFSTSEGTRDLYMELDTRYVKDYLGFPALLKDDDQSTRFKLPYSYSYAKYVDRHIVSASGNYPYPAQYDHRMLTEEGYQRMKLGGAVHYVYHADNVLLVISRPRTTFFPYFVAFSYILFLYLLISFLVPGVWIKPWEWKLLRSAFRRKLTLLVGSVLLFALLFMAGGSIILILRLYNVNNRHIMQERLTAARNSLEGFFNYAPDVWGPGFDHVGLEQVMRQLATDIQLHVNIYDPSGRLLRSSQNELFEKHLLSTRMSGEAFYELSVRRAQQFSVRERIGNLRYYSLYVPVYNVAGSLIAFANIPYIWGQTDVAKDISSIVAAVVNLYLIMLLLALVATISMTNQLAWPLDALSKKMRGLDVSKKSEHIQYSSNDELGALVTAYNKMVDDLEESSRRLAQSEREKTWKEMARQIAHDIKNPLTPMKLSIQHLVRMKSTGNPVWQERFDSLAASLIEQIDVLAQTASEFSSISHMEPDAPVELNALIQEQVALFTAGSHLKFTMDSQVPRALVLAKRTQLARVFVNLFTNANQAIKEDVIGLVHIRLTCEGDVYAVQVADNGPGVPPEYREKLFTPNFTTKSSGTGLGLAISRAIVLQSQGEITYSTSQWGGACFTLTFPVLRDHHPQAGGQDGKGVRALGQ